ncbi:MAG: AAA family ATPase [Deltaproteobacteria bacterium]|nr:AAA family ATPase [Deltaproteobacteria bacterium]
MPGARSKFYYGMIEEDTSKEIDAFLQSSQGILYLRWPLVFDGKLRLEDMENSSLFKLGPACKKETAEIKKLVNSDMTKYIVIPNLHLLAHAGEHPGGFYSRLVQMCNFYMNNHKIFFVLSCCRVPTAFRKENSLLDQWEFIACKKSLEESIEESQKNSSSGAPDLFLELRRIYGQLERHHFVKICPALEQNNIRDSFEVARNAQLDCLIKAIIESTLPFNSEIYLQDDQLLDERKPQEITGIKDKLRQLIFGQDEAIQRVVDVALMVYGSKRIDDRPRQIFLFVGPSGVGKTELCRQLAGILPGYRFLQINLAEYKDEHSVNKLIGVGRGYVESEAGGILTEPVRLYPRHIIIFDELDHGHSSVLQLFYKIFEGTIKDGRGRDVYFRDCFIIMTTNKGIISDDVSPEERRHKIENQLKQEAKDEKDRLQFSEAFLGRINWIIQFNRLNTSNLVDIARYYFEKRIVEPYHELGVEVNFEPVIKPQLLKENILDIRHQFFEIWALMIRPGEEQGARRLYQYMDEMLIYPLELFRINYREHFKKNYRIILRFQPCLLDLNYDKASILLIDDEADELGNVKDILKDYSVSVDYSDFKGKAYLEFVKRASMVLLDLLDKEGKKVGIDVLDELREKGLRIPMAIYTSLPDGPDLDDLKSNLWRYRINQYINKKSKDEIKKAVIFRAIQEYYLMTKCEKVAIDKAKLVPPTSKESLKNQAVFTLDYNIIGVIKSDNP